MFYQDTYFEIGFRMFFTVITHVGNTFVGNHFCRKHIAFVKASTDVDGASIDIPSSNNRIFRHTTVPVLMDPSVSFDASNCLTRINYVLITYYRLQDFYKITCSVRLQRTLVQREEQALTKRFYFNLKQKYGKNILSFNN